MDKYFACFLVIGFDFTRAFMQCFGKIITKDGCRSMRKTWVTVEKMSKIAALFLLV